MAQKFNLENTQITFRNLAGRPTEFDKVGGKRTFAAVLSEAAAEQLSSYGFDVKRFVNKETGELGEAYLKVKVNFRNNDEGELTGPFIYMVTKNDKGQIVKKTMLTPATAGIVDRADIKYVDLTITPSQWTVSGRSGIAAYLVKMFVVIDEDPLEKKYFMPDDNIDDVAEEIPFE